MLWTVQTHRKPFQTFCSIVFRNTPHVFAKQFASPFLWIPFPKKTEKNSGNEQPETIWLLQLCISSSHCSQKVKKQKNKIFSKANKKWKSKLISFSDGAVVLVVWLVSHLGLIPCVEPEKQEAGSKCGKLLSEHEIISTNWLLLAQSELSFFNRN